MQSTTDSQRRSEAPFPEIWALVALTLLVYDRTRSPLLTALAYAGGYLPWIIGGLFLAGLADRYSRRAVMVTCDMARAVLVTAMVIPGMPVLGLAALLFAATAFAPPARPGARPVQGQSPRPGSPRLRRAPRARVAQVVRQDAGRPPRRPQGLAPKDPRCFGN